MAWRTLLCTVATGGVICVTTSGHGFGINVKRITTFEAFLGKERPGSEIRIARRLLPESLPSRLKRTGANGIETRSVRA